MLDEVRVLTIASTKALAVMLGLVDASVCGSNCKSLIMEIWGWVSCK